MMTEQERDELVGQMVAACAVVRGVREGLRAQWQDTSPQLKKALLTVEVLSEDFRQLLRALSYEQVIKGDPRT
jgi:hypothetical protein